MHFPAFIFVDVFFLLFAVFIYFVFLLTVPTGQRWTAWVCKPEGAVGKGIFDRAYSVVDISVLFMYVQFLSSFDHSVMHWLNSGLNQKFWVTTTVSNYKCMQMLPSAASLSLMDTAHAQLLEL